MTGRHQPILSVAAIVGLALLSSPAPAQTDEQKPELEVVDGRWLTIRELPPILDHEEVEPELETGLTATFVFVVDLLGTPNGSTAGAARIGVRYELWDEIFHVTVYALDGLEQSVVGSRDELREWWSGLSLRLVDLNRSERPDGQRGARRARVRLDVVPFSQSEQVDTQRWFAESARRAEAAASQGDSSVVVDSEGGDSVFSLLIATSIRSRPLTSYSWTMDLPTQPEP